MVTITCDICGAASPTAPPPATWTVLTGGLQSPTPDGPPTLVNIAAHACEQHPAVTVKLTAA